MPQLPTTDKAPRFGERTQAQVIATAGNLLGRSPLPASYETYRRMRKHPPIAPAPAPATPPSAPPHWAVEKRGAGTPGAGGGFIDPPVKPRRGPRG